MHDIGKGLANGLGHPPTGDVADPGPLLQDGSDRGQEMLHNAAHMSAGEELVEIAEGTHTAHAPLPLLACCRQETVAGDLRREARRSLEQNCQRRLCWKRCRMSLSDFGLHSCVYACLPPPLVCCQ